MEPGAVFTVESTTVSWLVTDFQPLETKIFQKNKFWESSETEKGPADDFAQTALVATEVARVFQLTEFRELEGSRFSRLKTQTAENQSESGR